MKGQTRRELDRRLSCVFWCFAACVLIPIGFVVERVCPRREVQQDRTEV